MATVPKYTVPAAPPRRKVGKQVAVLSSGCRS